MEKVKGILNEEDFLKWVKEKDSERELTESDYKLLFGYLEGHGYALYADSEGCLYRIDVEADGTVLYSIDEMIMEVSDWNYDMLEQYSSGSCDNGICALKEEEKALDRMYLTTKVGKMMKFGLEQFAREEWK